MEYSGESLLPGQLGKLFGILSLVMSLIATVAYFKNVQAPMLSQKLKWLRIARVAFITASVAVMAILGLLFFILNNHLFEYKYAWQHSSLSLERKYLFAALWEGQEGSFLLWSFWQCLLGLVVIRFSRQWEGPVMAVISLAQVCLAALVSGITLSGVQVGSNPFVLLREVMTDPVFSQANYLSFIKDGNDLNPLLQNYWMVIHPPVLFLGFAACIVPFAYAVAALWTRKTQEWIKPVLPWTLFAAAALGTGIALGGLWAYESLSFGGYWAWDPVENASLVPWLLLVAAIHALIIYKRTGFSLKSCFLLIISSFLLVLYSTYLTRSGILGDTSVHAFGAGGVSFQILIFLGLFSLPVLLLYIIRRRSIPAVQSEERMLSREWWMFMGALIFSISAGSIIYMTSLPVFNQVMRLFSTGDPDIFKPMAPGADALYSYNRIQVWVVIGLSFLAGLSQFLNYRITRWQQVLKRSWQPLLFSIGSGILLLQFIPLDFPDKGIGFQIAIWLAFIMAVYVFIASVFFFFRNGRMNSHILGSVLAHGGFGLMIAGILLSSVGKEVLSLNQTGLPAVLPEAGMEKQGENLTLFKNIKTRMDDYWVTYRADSVHTQKPLWYYKIGFNAMDKTDSFELAPTAFVNYKNREGLMSNPAARHYWNHDLFAYITSLADPLADRDTIEFRSRIIKKGQPVLYKGYSLQLLDMQMKTNIPLAGFEISDSVYVATISVGDTLKNIKIVKPVLIKRGSDEIYLDDSTHNSRMQLRLLSTAPDGGEIAVREATDAIEFLTLKVYRFPFISFLWIGVAILMSGFLLSMIHRVNDTKRAPGKKIAPAK
ncbi:MAG: cytochrome c biogenesis protein CcsA [Chitinophagaceae bacterium]